MKIVCLHINDLEPNEVNPFPKIEPKFFQKLCDSIQSNGLLHPLAVIKNEENDKYKILDGNHRYEALKKIGTIVEIPCIIVDQENLFDYIFDPNMYRRHLPNNAIDFYEHEKHQEETNLLINRLPHEILFLYENKKINKTEALRLARLPWKTLKDFVAKNLTSSTSHDNDKNNLIKDAQEKIKTIEAEINQKNEKIKELELKVKRMTEEIKEELIEKAKEVAREELECEYEIKIEAIEKDKEKMKQEIDELTKEKTEIRKQIQTLQTILNNKDAVIQSLSEELDKQKTLSQSSADANNAPKPAPLSPFLVESIMNTFVSSNNSFFGFVSNNAEDKTVKDILKRNIHKLKQALDQISNIIELIEE